MARPKRVFNDEIVQQMQQYALEGCQNNTIATILDIPMTTLKRRFGKLLTKKRCERKQKLREYQLDLAKTNPAMAIFLGKNELGQTDKQTISNEPTEKPIDLSTEELKELKQLAGMMSNIKYKTRDTEPETQVAEKNSISNDDKDRKLG